MWASIATNVVTAAIDHFIQKKSLNSPEVPIMNKAHLIVMLQRGCPTNFYRYSSNVSHGEPHYQGSSSCHNCNSSANGGQKQQNNSFKKQNDNNKYCKVVLPETGDFEIKIIKIGSQSAKTSSKLSQNTWKEGVNNTTKQTQNANNSQNAQNSNRHRGNGSQNKLNGPIGNQSRPNSNQNRQNGNHNRPSGPTGNHNRSNGYQDIPNGNNSKPNGYQNRQNGNQNRQNGKLNKSNVNWNNPNITVNLNLNELNLNPNKRNGNQKKSNVNQYKLNVPSGSYQNRPNNNTPNIVQVSMPSNGQTTWMYLGRLKVGTTEFDIKGYLEAKFHSHNFIVETLPLYRNAKLPCFKVNVENRILEEFQNLENWPLGVKITKFHENFKC